MRKITLDLTKSEDRKEIQQIIKEQMGFPDHYGENLDALNDCLGEISDATCVGVYEPAEGTESDSYFRSLNKVFSRAEKDNPDLCVFIFREMRS